MFRRKKKTRVEKAREDIEKQIRVVNKQAETTRKDFIKGLNNTATELRGSIEHLFDREERQQVQEVAHNLEKIANRVENRAGKRLHNVEDVVEDNPWVTILVSVLVGLIFGIIIKELMD